MIERVFYIVEEGVVHISGELLDNGDGRLEYLEYVGCFIPVDELTADAITDAEEQCHQYYRKITETEGETIAREYFDGNPGSILQLAEVNVTTKPGCYVSFTL